MAYCRNCGATIDEKAVICPKCGVSQQSDTDSGSIGYGILGFFIPIVGLILYLTWKDTKPKTAKSAGVGALVSFIMSLAFTFIYIMLVFVIFASIGMSY